jgi:hypothetical protein
MGDARELALQLVALGYAKQRLLPALEELRDLGKDELIPEEKIFAVSPIDGEVLGHITRTNPSKSAKVTDEAQLMAHLAEKDPDSLEDVTVIVGSEQQVIDVLRVHAPHLLGTEVRIRDWARHAACKLAHEGPIPGVTVSRPVGTVVVYPSKDKGPEIEALFTAGRVQLDGVVVKAIEAATEGEQ